MEAIPELRAICEDYDSCVNALNYWSAVGGATGTERVEEYRVIACELESEITAKLAAYTPDL